MTILHPVVGIYVLFFFTTPLMIDNGIPKYVAPYVNFSFFLAFALGLWISATCLHKRYPPLIIVTFGYVMMMVCIAFIMMYIIFGNRFTPGLNHILLPFQIFGFSFFNGIGPSSLPVYHYEEMGLRAIRGLRMSWRSRAYFRAIVTTTLIIVFSYNNSDALSMFFIHFLICIGELVQIQLLNCCYSGVLIEMITYPLTSGWESTDKDTDNDDDSLPPAYDEKDQQPLN